MESIHWAFDFVRHLQDHLNDLIGWTGLPLFYAIMFLVVFCETGLVVTPILPGDSLLFAAGAFAAHKDASLDYRLLIVLLTVAAIAGDAVNYAIGHFMGPKVLTANGRFLKREYLDRTHRFYER